LTSETSGESDNAIAPIPVLVTDLQELRTTSFLPR
jgi:hypothetical protein